MIFEPAKIRHVDQLSLKGKKYFWFAGRETCMARDEIWIQWFLLHGVHSLIAIPNDRIEDYYLEEQSSLRFFDRFEETLRHHWSEYIQTYKKKKSMAVMHARHLARMCATRDNVQIIRAFRSYCDSAYSFAEYLWSAWAVIYVTEKRVMEHCMMDVPLIMSLEEPIAFFIMQEELFCQSDVALAARYGWLNMYNPYERPYGPAYFSKLRKETNRRDITKERKKYQETRKKFRALLRRLHDPLLQQSVAMVHAYAFLKTDRMDVWRQMMAELRKFYRYLATLVPEITLHDATNLTIQEIEEILAGQKIPTRAEIRRRSANRALYFFHSGTIEILHSGAEIKKTLGILQGAMKNIHEFRGVIACQGKARGRARIVTHSIDLAKVRKGDVLVAKYTFPTYTPAMLKSVAIVTDEGGLTSHAAILSREYRIPCIIATKIATQVLKDGDMVEVDAEVGVVRKIIS